jgi:predicted patatin/cPLA2 family phospholipase
LNFEKIAETDLYKLIKSMPKGALLHTHVSAALDIKKYLEHLEKNKKSIYDQMYIVTDASEVGKYNKELYIFGTNFTKGIEICFSHINHPNMDIFLALRITISMPYMLYPVIINNEYYLDGAITNSFPIDYCNQDNTIGIFIKYHIQNNFINFFDIYKKSLNILCDIVVENKINNYKNIITIMSDSKNNIKGITNLNIDKKYKQYLFKLGYNCAKIHYS